MESLLTLRQQVDPALRCRRVKPDRVPSSVKTAGLDWQRRQGCLIQLGMGGICRVGGLCSRPTSKERVSCFYFFSEWLRQARHAHAARTYENLRAMLLRGRVDISTPHSMNAALHGG